MTTPTKLQIIDSLTATGALMAALGTLPVDSADLPMPPEWRPYIISIGFGAAFLSRLCRIVVSNLKPPEA